MTSLKVLTLSTILFFSLQLSAQDATIVKESFKVRGNCNMCKSTIEKAAKSIDGVESAKWSTATKKINVKFRNDKTSLDEIKKAIVSSGYDLEDLKASDEDYNNLHKCCKYDRE